MCSLRYSILGLLFWTFSTVQAQDHSLRPGDTAITFKVYGACVQCKERIEKAARGRGVRSVSWNVNTKLLSLVYEPTLTNPDKIGNRIVAAGHDLETKKAIAAVYQSLPNCCHYREMGSMEDNEKMTTNKMDSNDSIHTRVATPLTVDTSRFSNVRASVKGIVLEADRKGAFKPLQKATVIWLGTNVGTATDADGIFEIRPSPGTNKLIVSYTGYISDTLNIVGNNELKIILATDRKLGEVVVTSRIRSSYLLNLNPIRTQVVTEKELFKAACCNLSESFETNPSVDVSYNDAVTGSKQIQLLGLSGNYTQLTVENMPGPRGLATPLGLNAIAGPWVESIQLTKGIGSVVNGYESIAGQINVELKKPETAEAVYANAYINDIGKSDLNLDLAQKIGNKWAVGLLLHDDWLANKQLDFNKDGFRDLPTGNQFSLVNRWKYDGGKGFMFQFGVKALADRRTGGETAFDPAADKNTFNHYGLGINTDRYEGFAKVGYVYPSKKYKSIGLQLSVINHQQDSYFGRTSYAGKQENLYGNLIYQSIIGNTNHKFRTGASFLYDDYRENFRLTNYNRTEIVPGAFFEYTFTHLEKFNLVAGLRADHNSLFGFFLTPRLHVRYEPVKGTTIRFSAGRGQRTANIFAENNSAFVSSRQVSIINPQAGKAYGLDPEVAWNKGLSIDQKFRVFNNDAVLSLDFFRNDFVSQVIADLENARELKFYNSGAASFSNSFQAELNMEPLKLLNLRLAYRYFDVKTTYSGKLLERPLISKNRAFANLAYGRGKWKADYTISYNGRKRIPGTAVNPPEYQLPDYSPGYVLMNAQFTLTIGKQHPMDLYIGSENIGNYFQKNAIIAAAQPFGPYFDASLIYAPVSGRMLYLGWRMKLK